MLPEIVREWIDKAEEDYGFASVGMECSKYFPQICFHFQQAAEKFLKAFIIAKKLDFRPVHNLLELLRTCRQAAPDAMRLEEACRFLNPFYIDTRVSRLRGCRLDSSGPQALAAFRRGPEVEQGPQAV